MSYPIIGICVAVAVFGICLLCSEIATYLEGLERRD